MSRKGRRQTRADGQQKLTLLVEEGEKRALRIGATQTLEGVAQRVKSQGR